MDKTAPIRLTSFEAALIGHNRGEKGHKGLRVAVCLEKKYLERMGWVAVFLIGGGFTIFLTMAGDLQGQLIGLVVAGIGFVFYKMDVDKPK